MKLKLTKKISGDTDGIIVMVEYGPEEEPKKKYIGKWNLGAVAEVTDEIGYIIMAKYHGSFTQVFDTKEKVAVETK